MDELTLLRDFRAERADEDPRARAAGWRALEARFDAAATSPAPAAARGRGLLPRRGRSLPVRHRRLLALAGATAIAAVVAAILVLGSGPTAQSAAAEVLRETAGVATSPAGPAASPFPGPGQFAYRKFERLELQGWVPGGGSSGGGLMRRPDAFNALMPTTQEWWTAADGAGRVREVAGTPRFLSSAEQDRWEAAGSRLPAPFDPEYQRKYPLAYKNALELRRGVVDTEHPKLKGFHFPDNTDLPTEPAALRRAIETHGMKGAEFDLDAPTPKPRDTEETIEGLFNILVEGPTTPQLRAAVFNALAELPGIQVDTDAADFLGRQGYAVRSVDRQEGGGIEFIFDPETAALLAEREFLSAPGQSPYLKGLPAGLTIRETAYIEDAVVDSSHETGAEAEAGGPVATSGPTYREGR